EHGTTTTTPVAMLLRPPLVLVVVLALPVLTSLVGRVAGDASVSVPAGDRVAPGHRLRRKDIALGDIGLR
ncbi:hypothetical protein, partial [Streptomyces sp. NPDC059159]|uniref:hypothetical protein n=1 Tax=Streptomyces sp. NPDC059159 TaxID=3346747 RepID=UPI0036858E01